MTDLFYQVTFGSVCSGIEAASVAWNPLGWKAAWFSEIEPFPCALLSTHYPDTPNLGDMTDLPDKIRLGLVQAPDVFCGGTPCQAFSVAGLRKSLSDKRGSLSLTFCEIANEIDAARACDGQQPCVVFWENVPGVLNTKDNAFGCFLAELAGEDEALVAPGGKWSNAGAVLGPKRAVAWRVLDAQYFGVAQRRRRVFVVASARNGFDPSAVLFEFDGVRRDIAPSRVEKKEDAGNFGNRSADCFVSEVSPTLLSSGKAAGSATQQDAENGSLIGTFALQHAQIGRQNKSGPQGKGWQYEVAFTQDSRPCADAVAFVAINGVAQVRRLTPRENERLQGFPDDYTLIPFGRVVRQEKLDEDWIKYLMRGGKMRREDVAGAVADAHRYQAIGNSWAVPNVQWIGRRIDRFFDAEYGLNNEDLFN